MEETVLKIALVGGAGMGAQWLAWRLHLPAIVLLLAAGLAAGPATGFLQPAADFGEIYRPMISIAVAIILFEGGLSLNLHEISETSKAVRRIILIGGPLTWLFTALSAHFVGGLSWPTAIVIGAVLIVTGPTVVIPLLRQAGLKSRPASILRWEAIVNDPIGALCAVIAFEAVLVSTGYHDPGHLVLRVVAAALLAVVGGWAAASAIAWAFIRGHVPEYLKAPLLVALVLLVYALTNLVLEEAGLLTVTVMGIVLANRRIASLADMRRFKETITTLLVSGVFILLTASLTPADIAGLDWPALLFVASLLFAIRPAAIFIATARSGATWQERLLAGWIAPRGVVAVAVSGLFGTLMADAGIADAPRMAAFTFAVVVTTIVLHGFTLVPLAAALGLRHEGRPGILIVGGSRWSTALARKLHENDVQVMLADPNWNHLAEARQSGLPVYYGEALSENAHETIEPHRFAHLIAATDNDAYNALVCTDFGPELGRSNVYQIGRSEGSERRQLSFTLGGRPLTRPGLPHTEWRDRFAGGWTFQVTRLSAEFGWEAYLAGRPEDAIVLLWVRPSGAVVFAATATADPGPEDRVFSFGRPLDKDGRVRAKEASTNRQPGSEP